MHDLVVVGGWIAPVVAIFVCVLAVLVVLGWRGVTRDRAQEDAIRDLLSGDDGHHRGE